MTVRHRFQLTGLVILLLLIALPSLSPAGGERSSVAGMSMGRAFVASGRGLEAVGTNPANLVLPHRGKGRIFMETWSHDDAAETDSTGDDSTGSHENSITHRTYWETPPSVSFSIVPFGLSIGTDFANYDIYKEYFTGIPDTNGDGQRESRFLSDEDKRHILEVFPDGVSETHTDFDLRLFGLTIHNDWLGDLAFTVTDRASMNFNLPKDYLEFAFFGLDSNGSHYDFSGTDIQAWYLREYAMSYARKIPQVTFIDDFAAGLTLKLVHGYALAITDRYEGTFSNRREGDDAYVLNGSFDFRMLRSTSPDIDEDSENITPFPTPAGQGFGVDFGVSGIVTQGIRAGMSITDIGSLTWTENTKETIGQSEFSLSNPTSQEQTDSLKEAFEGEDIPTGEFSTSLATAFRIGAAVQVDELPFISWFPGEMLISLEYQQGLNDSPGNTTRSRFAVGTEYRPVRWFPIRTGASFGGVDRFNWAGGFGLDFGGFSWNFGTENVGMLFSPGSYDQLSFGMSMIIRI